MALFTKAPEKNLTRDRDAAKANVDRLALKLHDAEANVIATKSLAQRAALAGDDAGLDAAEVCERAALHRYGTLATAYAEANKMLAFLNESIETVTDQRVRAATSVATLALADELVELGDAYLASTRALNECATRALAVSFELNGLVVFTASSTIEVAAALPIVAACLKQHSRAVVNHQAAAAMPLVPEPPAKPVAAQPKAPTVRVFTTRPIKYLDQDGKQVSSGKCVDHDLPTALVERALSSGAVVRLDNPMRKQNLGAWPGHYSTNACFDLNAADASAPPIDPVVHSAFQPLPGLRAPSQLKVAAGGA
jgi:hypothetical protein